MAEAQLVKTVRSLDQDSQETVDAKLVRLWDALSASSQGGHFHAAEEVILRWLLKNMHVSGNGAAAAEAETLRRWPLTWHILACIFRRIPVFSLAKSLADRRFVAVLQQTAKDLATPPKPSAAATVTTTTSGKAAIQKKRKRSQALSPFDLEALREPDHRLASTSALFGALRALLDCMNDNDKPAADYRRIGAEHIRSLFSVSSSDAMVLLVPLIRLCNFAMTAPGSAAEMEDERKRRRLEDDKEDDDEEEETKKPISPLESQSTWIHTFTAFWDIHLQGPTDVIEVATHLTPFCCAMLARLKFIPGASSGAAKQAVTLGEEVQRRWASALKRFLTKNLLLPARSAFLNRKDIQPVILAVGDVPASAALRSSVLFYLALEAPRIMLGGKLANKDNQVWLQEVFDRIQEPICSSEALDATSRNRVLAELLDLAAKHGAAPSSTTLQALCRQCALAGGKPVTEKARETREERQTRAAMEAREGNATTDWRLLDAVAHCDADIFLSSEEGEKLLDDVLQDLATSQSTDHALASSFLVSLAKGYASMRNFSGFIMRWYRSICVSDNVQSPVHLQSVWLDRGLRAIVTSMLPSALTKDQLLALLEQLDQQAATLPASSSSTSVTIAKLAILDAVSAGIQSEEFQDAIQARLLDRVLKLDVASVSLPAIQAIRWRLVRRTLAWVDLDERLRIWDAVRPSLKAMASLKDGESLYNENAFEAFVCTFSVWMALEFGGGAEVKARDLTLKFFKRIQKQLASLKTDAERLDLATQINDRVNAMSMNNINTPDLFQTDFNSKYASLGSYLAWMLHGSLRFVDEMTKSSDEPSDVLDTLTSWQSGAATETYPHLGDMAFRAILSNVANLQNEKITKYVMEKYVKALEEAADKQAGTPKEVVIGLLKTPANLFYRRLRERTFAALFPRDKDAKAFSLLSAQEAVLVLDLLIRVTREQTSVDAGFDRLLWLGEAIEKLARQASAPSSLGMFDRLHRVATAILKHDFVDPNRKYVAKLEDFVKSLSNETASLNVRLVLLKAILAAAKDAAASQAESIDVSKARKVLASLVAEIVPHYMEEREKGFGMTAKDYSDDGYKYLPLQLAFDAALTDDMRTELGQKEISMLVETANVHSENLFEGNWDVLWLWKAFLARYLSGPTRPPREVAFDGLSFMDTGKSNAVLWGLLEEEKDCLSAASFHLGTDLLQAYLTAETEGYSQEALLLYVEDLVSALDKSSTVTAHLLAIRYLVEKLLVFPGAVTAQIESGFGLGTVHSRLAQMLPRACSLTDCQILAQILHTLMLDDKAASAMGQWNIDTTLSAVAQVVARQPSTSDAVGGHGRDCVRASPLVYADACRLVEAVLKRHRLRLEGRFHLLVGTLQALLTRLVWQHQEELKERIDDAAGGSGNGSSSISSAGALPSWEAQAKRFSRLLELVCEPSTAAVTTTRGAAAMAPLNSATDAAKRSAGQHMYLVLMLYIKLQIDGAVVSRRMREALEPGLFSIMGISSEEIRRLLLDAVDASGRVLFKDMYRRWLQFGKWKGV